MPKQPVICRAKCIRLVGTSIPYRISFVYPSTKKIWFYWELVRFSLGNWLNALLSGKQSSKKKQQQHFWCNVWIAQLSQSTDTLAMKEFFALQLASTKNEPNETCIQLQLFVYPTRFFTFQTFNIFHLFMCSSSFYEWKKTKNICFFIPCHRTITVSNLHCSQLKTYEWMEKRVKCVIIGWNFSLTV